MNEKNRDIDLLLRRNVDQQLEGFDWEGLRRDIGSRLASTDAPVRLRSLYGKWAAVAAALALAAGVLIYAAVCASGPGAYGVSDGEASVVMIAPPHMAAMAEVSFPPAEKPGQCEVTILASDKPRPEGGKPTSWCIVVGQDPLTDRRSGSRDASDVACLF